MMRGLGYWKDKLAITIICGVLESFVVGRQQIVSRQQNEIPAEAGTSD
jgi:hypothetical protein